MYGEELQWVEVFKYLGRLLLYYDNDTQAMRANLAKAHRYCAQVSQVLRSENASPKVCGVFYKVTIQAVLLFGSETWNSVPLGMACLEGFHLRAAWLMSGTRPQKKTDGTWKYPARRKSFEMWDCKVSANILAYGGSTLQILLSIGLSFSCVWKE